MKNYYSQVSPKKLYTQYSVFLILAYEQDNVQLAFEQDGFELFGSNYMQIFL